jgi:hypothetical protein
MVASCCLEHIGNKFGSNGSSGFIFLVLSSIWKARYDCSDSSSGGSATGVNHDEKFHEVVVDAVCASLEDEDVFIADRLACY